MKLYHRKYYIFRVPEITVINVVMGSPKKLRIYDNYCLKENKLAKYIQTVYSKNLDYCCFILQKIETEYTNAQNVIYCIHQILMENKSKK